MDNIFNMLQINSTDEIEYFEPDDTYLGLSYAQWTVEWWRWALGYPRSENPVTDPVGKFASYNQRHGIWFLAGKLADEDSSVPCRQCSIPNNTALLFPVMNCEANKLEFPNLDDEGLITNVTDHMELIRVAKCSINSKEIPVQRVRAEPQIFMLDVSEDNIFDIACGQTYASADGYWVFLKPLKKVRSHEMRFYGSCTGGIRHSGATYKIRID